MTCKVKPTSLSCCLIGSLRAPTAPSLTFLMVEVWFLHLGRMTHLWSSVGSFYTYGHSVLITILSWEDSLLVFLGFWCWESNAGPKACEALCHRATPAAQQKGDSYSHFTDEKNEKRRSSPCPQSRPLLDRAASTKKIISSTSAFHT